MGLLDNGLLQMTGVNRPGTPTNTLAQLSGVGAGPISGSGQGQVPGYGSQGYGPNTGFKPPYKSDQTIELPALTPPDTEGALDRGAQRAQDSLKKPDSSSSSPLGFHPEVLNLAKALGGEGGNSDRSMAIAKGGIGMALAGGQTGNFLTALAAGANSGFDEYKNLQAVRAQRAMEQAKFNTENQYKQATLAQQQAYQTGTLGIQQQQVGIQQGQLAVQQATQALAAAKSPVELDLLRQQIQASKGDQVLKAAEANLRNAQATALTGGNGGIPQAILKEVGPRVDKELSGVSMPPEQLAAEKQARTLTYAKQLMEMRGMPTDHITAFAPATPPPGPAVPPPAPKQPWVGGSFGVPEEGAEKSSPLLANPVVMVPGNQLATLAQRGSFGAIDLGTVRNQAQTSLLELKNDFQNLAKTSGRAVKDQMDTINHMMPRQGVFVSAPENFDTLTKIASDLRENYLSDTRMAQDPAVPKAQRDIAAKSAPLEARILHRIAGTQDIGAFKRFDGPGGAASKKTPSGPAVGSIEDGHKFKGGDPADQSNWELVK